jgi:CDP-glycerol glycerophosphotransferase
MPKVDCLVDGSLRRDEVLTSIGIDPARRTVLYAPTWSAYSSLPMMGEEIVRRLTEAGYAVIVKLHDRSRDVREVNSGGVDWGDRLAPLLRAGGGVLATGANASRYLAASDVLISDHSSVAFEFLLLDRPVLRIHVPELIARTDIEPLYVEMLAKASTTIRAGREVVTAVEDCLADPDRQSAERRAVAAEMFHDPGTATSRAVKEIYETIELAAPAEIVPGTQPFPVPSA